MGIDNLYEEFFEEEEDGSDKKYSTLDHGPPCDIQQVSQLDESEGDAYFKVYFNTYNWHILKVSMILYYHVIVCILYIIGTEYILETILLVILVWLYD